MPVGWTVERNQGMTTLLLLYVVDFVGFCAFLHGRAVHGLFYGNWRGQRDLRTKDRVLRCGYGAEEEHARPERNERMHFRRSERTSISRYTCKYIVAGITPRQARVRPRASLQTHPISGQRSNFTHGRRGEESRYCGYKFQRSPERLVLKQFGALSVRSPFRSRIN